MKYAVEKSEEYALVSLQEENLNSLKAPELKSELILLKNAGNKNLILDLSAVKYVDSSGLSAILTGNRLWTEEGGQFVLTGVEHPSVKTLISISRLDSVLDIKENLEQAVKWVMMQTLRSQLENETPAEEDEV